MLYSDWGYDSASPQHVSLAFELMSWWYLNNMLTRLSYIECPVCKKKIKHNQVISVPQQSKWALIQKEIKCPFCENLLIMNKRTLKRFQAVFLSITLLLFLMVFDWFRPIISKSNWGISFILALVLLWSSYVLLAVYTTKYEAKKNDGA